MAALRLAMAPARCAWPWQPRTAIGKSLWKKEDTGRPKPPGVSRRGKKRRETTRFRKLTTQRGVTHFRQHAS